MTGPLRVDPALLHRAADEMDQLLAAHRQAHTSAHGLISSATSGWVGDAAAALGSESTEWQAASRHIANESEHYRDAFARIGYAFAATEEQTAVNILQTRLPKV